jgi:hypothetical protein
VKKQHLLKFIQAWEKMTGQKISEVEALEHATTLLNLYQAVVGDLLDTKKKNNDE